MMRFCFKRKKLPHVVGVFYVLKLKLPGHNKFETGFFAANAARVYIGQGFQTKHPNLLYF
jgi:hypothetical protein